MTVKSFPTLGPVRVNIKKGFAKNGLAYQVICCHVRNEIRMSVNLSMFETQGCQIKNNNWPAKKKKLLKLYPFVNAGLHSQHFTLSVP